MNNKFYDISMAITSDTIVFPNDPEIYFTDNDSISKGDICNTWNMSFGSHTGTHIDAPKHFFDDGLTVDKLSLDHFIGKAKVFEVKNKKAVELKDIVEFDIEKDDIILLKTTNSDLPSVGEFNKDFVYIAPEAAAYFAQKGIKTLGVDYLSVEKFGSVKHESHHILLGNNIVIIEGLRLKGIEPGIYDMTGLPINIVNGNGSPIRVVLSK